MSTAPDKLPLYTGQVAPTAKVTNHTQSATSVLSQHGKSFYFASKLLDERTALRAARLYRFCRHVDDIADLASDKSAAKQQLDEVSRALRLDKAPSSDAIVDDFLALSAECGIARAPALELIAGIRSDLDEVRIGNLEELLQYCYRVAGTVGVMMCAVLGVRDPIALPFAIDLGIGMQLTNIVRDVSEDAIAGRRYLPATMIGDINPELIRLPDEKLRPQLQQTAERLLNIADKFYQSGEKGLVYLPDRARLGIRVAANVYHRIGTRIRQQDCATWQGRAVVPTWEKISVAAGSVANEFLSRRATETALHDRRLHQALAGFFGSDPSVAALSMAKPHD